MNVRRSACEAVGKIGENAGTDAVITALVIAFGDPDLDVRISACKVIDRISEKVGTSAVIDGLVIAPGDRDPNVRRDACEAVGRMGEKAGMSATIDQLLIALEDQDSEVRWSARVAVSRIGERAGTIPVIHASFIIMQDKELWGQKRYEKVLRSVLGVAHMKPAGNLIAIRLKRSCSRSEVCPFRTIWLASMSLAYGVTVNDNMIYIYSNENPEAIENVGANQIDELMREFAEQKDKYLSAGISMCCELLH